MFRAGMNLTTISIMAAEAGRVLITMSGELLFLRGGGVLRTAS